MSATREYRNAALIEEKVNEAVCALEEAAALCDELGSALPDDFPPLHDELAAAEKALGALAERASE